MTDGFLLTEGIVLILTGAVLLVCAIRQYREKGPVLSVAYFAADAQDRPNMRTPKAYRWAGNVLLYPSIVCLLFGISFVTQNHLFSYAGTVLLTSGVLSGVIFVAAR